MDRPGILLSEDDSGRTVIVRVWLAPTEFVPIAGGTLQWAGAGTIADGLDVIAGGHLAGPRLVGFTEYGDRHVGVGHAPAAVDQAPSPKVGCDFGYEGERKSRSSQARRVPDWNARMSVGCKSSSSFSWPAGLGRKEPINLRVPTAQSSHREWLETGHDVTLRAKWPRPPARGAASVTAPSGFGHQAGVGHGICRSTRSP